MKSSKNGKNISVVSIENITRHGLWIFVNGKEYFLGYETYPYFENANIKALNNVKLSHGHHLYWPELDIDLEVDNFEHPENYPLIGNQKHKGSILSGTKRVLNKLKPIKSVERLAHGIYR